MFSLFIALGLMAQPSAAELISTGVGLIRKQVITSREVQYLNLAETVLYDKNQRAPLTKLGLDSKAFAKAVQDTLLEAVLAQEAQSFNVMPVSPEELQAAEKHVLKAVKGNRAWQEMQVRPKELREGLKRKLQAKKFVQFRSDSSVLPVTDSEAQRYFEENRLKFGDLPFENFKENIKSYLSKAQVEKRMKEWFDVLLNKYQVKNLISEM